jgi:hypothetical protein
VKGEERKKNKFMVFNFIRPVLKIGSQESGVRREEFSSLVVYEVYGGFLQNQIFFIN